MRKLSLGLVLLFLLQLGVSASQSPVDPKRSSPTPKGSKAQGSFSSSSVATPQGVGNQIVQFFGRKTGKELMMEKAKNASGTGTAAKKASSGKSPAQSVNAVPLKPGYVPPPPTPRASVPEIRQEIQKILDLNKKIKNLKSGRAVQLQRVQEQARIHQRILNELESSQKQADGKKPSAKTALLAQEKLRIIHEETQRNSQAINDMNAMPAGAVSKTVDKVKTVAS